jgi:hypothetical protein
MPKYQLIVPFGARLPPLIPLIPLIPLSSLIRIVDSGSGPPERESLWIHYGKIIVRVLLVGFSNLLRNPASLKVGLLIHKST